MDNDKRPRDSRGGKTPQTILILVIATVVTFLVVSFMADMLRGSSTQEVPYGQFWSDLNQNRIERVTITSSQINYQLKDQKGVAITYFTGYLPNDTELIPVLKASGVEYKRAIENTGSTIIDLLVIYVLPLLLFWLLLSFLMKRMGGGGVMGVGKSNAKMVSQKATGVTFRDVAGQDEAKESLIEIVDFLKNPGKYTMIGAKLPKGALLVGPPGTGKTLLAKAVAGEAGVPFFSLSGSDFVEMFVGVGASRVRDLFKNATQQAPCIIFIDEIDAIGKTRDSHYGGNDEREQTLNQLLAEMDGFDSSKGIFMLGATNRPEILDPALLRPGRFDRRIIVDKPDLKGRINTLKVHSTDVKMDESVDFEAIALATSGAVGSDLANMVNEAAINAVKNGRSLVCQADLLEAVETVLVGREKKDRIMGPEERRIVSFHEVGHAMVSAYQKHSEPVQKITIVPRTMGALGYVMSTPEEERFLNSKDELWDMIVMALGGRAAEEVIFSSITTGAANDIEKATRIARAMVTQYGMSEEFGLMGLETIENQYLTGRTVMNCADDTAAKVDLVIKDMLKKAYDEAKEIIVMNRFAMDEIAEFLIEKETITGKEFMEIFDRVGGEYRGKAAEAEKAAVQAEASQAEVSADTAQDFIAAPAVSEETAQAASDEIPPIEI